MPKHIDKATTCTFSVMSQHIYINGGHDEKDLYFTIFRL